MTQTSPSLSSLSATSSSYLESLATHLPDSLRSVISRFAVAFWKSPTTPPPLLSRLDSLVTLLNTYFLASPARLVVTLLAFLIAILAMNSRYPLKSWRNSATFGGAVISPPEIDDDDFTYLTSDDIDRSQYSGDPRYVPRQASQLSDDLEPDIISLRYRGTSHTLHFPAYAIGDGILTVGDVRRETAKKLGIASTRHVKLFYKGRLLREDALPAREAGLKQHSEILCVVADPMSAAVLAQDPSIELSENDVSQYYDSFDDDQPIPQRRRSRRRGDLRNTGAPSPSSRGRLLEPVSREHTQSQSQSAHLSPAMGRARSSSRVSTSPYPSPNLGAFRTPLEKLDTLTKYFRTSLEPLCNEYIDNPPADRKTRESKHKKLSEMTMDQVILKADEIELDGDEIARQQRKALIMEVQMVLKQMDEAVKL